MTENDREGGARMAKGLEDFSSEAAMQAAFIEIKGIFAYVSLLRAAASASEERGPIRDVLTAAWAARDFWSPFERPLLLCASLRDDALADPNHPLAKAIGEGATGKDEVTREQIEASIDLGNFRQAIIHRAVQTNETSRAIVWRLALKFFERDGPIALVDLGCSAGLNLIADRLAISWPDDHGQTIALTPTDRLVARIGLDRRPIDVSDPLEARWLRACLWPGQNDRLSRLDEALARGRRARELGELELANVEAHEMPDFLERLMMKQPKLRVLAMQTAFIDYLAPEVRKTFETGMRSWLAKYPSRASFVELGAPTQSITSASTHRPHTAEIRLHRGTTTRALAGCDWHPTEVTLLGAA